MDFFYSLIIVSFSLSIFLFISFNFLYKKLMVCFEEIKQIKQFNEETFETIQDLNLKNTEHRIITEDIQTNQRNLNESFGQLETSFQTLKETATELQSAHQTKKAMLDLMKG